MREWFFVSAWLEKAETQVHFEIANEDGEQFFFYLRSDLLVEKLPSVSDSALDRFYYAEEDMLSLAVTILDEEMIEDVERIFISSALFNKYF